jgi:DNA-binding XRE family transcriptional regulator
MRQKEFQSLMNMAKTMQSLSAYSGFDFWKGFQYGLRRLYHGENYGSHDGHVNFLNHYNRNLQTGYRTGFYRNQYKIDSGLDIQKLRQLLNLSVVDLAEIAAVSHRTIEGWEQGRPMSEAARQLIRKYLMIS